MDDQSIQLRLLNADEEAQQASSTNLSRTRLASWAWETGGIILSAALIVTLVVLLRYYDGRREPAWEHMSLNTLIAWLSTITKACVLFSASQGLGQLKWAWFSTQKRPLDDLGGFDAASRGVLGGLALIFRVRGRHFAVVGSLAIVLAVGFDPFVQNLVHYVPRSVVDASQSCLLGNTSMYNTVGPLMGGDLSYVDPVLKANVYNSLFNPSSSQTWATPQNTCSTGNCVWEPSANLAVRALCSNVTSYLERSYTYVSNGSYVKCTVTLGSNGTLSTQYLSTGSGAQPMVVTTVESESALVYQNASLPVVQYILARGSNDGTNGGGGIATDINNGTQFIATECALEPLVRSVQASVSQGVYQETLLADWATVNTTAPMDAGYSDFRVAFSPGWKNSSGLGLNSPGELFALGFEAWDSMIVFFEALFEGFVSAGSDVFEFEPSGADSYATTDALEAIFYGNFSSSCAVDDQLTCAMENVATAISKTIRDSAFTSGEESDVATTVNTNITMGHTMTTVSFVAVHWQWLLLPLFVWLLATVSWIGAVWKSGPQIPVWKNDILPLLFLYRPADRVEMVGKDIPVSFRQETRVRLNQGHLINT
ncbi:hypothetical protein ASPZODRAFT_105830 [Penicilliopsis zonata CBS 506.65]|uniref:Uncharacterized protein n=1 Tax=Penicilliopsis zonata CBS 506.65 TaxID=1073090 RepID=A0A1L9S4J5_9EURO|nr:hypothetical protein ASPZODRAFT_105830 [Penicilliopsis zonata CBS 506.65]OJJ42091.1 hypothetical protein ASPZODRAFT_105830 [Penicilliopsis zonata CBS 506.65]